MSVWMLATSAAVTARPRQVKSASMARRVDEADLERTCFLQGPCAVLPLPAQPAGHTRRHTAAPLATAGLPPARSSWS